jgi:hypothetical protein
MVDHLASAWFCTLSALQAKPRSLLGGSALWVPPYHQRLVVVPRSDLTAWYVCWETRTVTYPAKGGTQHV